MSGKNRKCVICCKQENRTQKTNMFFTTFPSNENRCREWLRLVGIPELVFLPIEKLHTIRYICGDHFEKKFFNRKKNRVNKIAVPTQNMRFRPLTDDQLNEFPQHMWNYNKGLEMFKKCKRMANSSNTAGDATAGYSEDIAEAATITDCVDSTDIQEGTAITDSANIQDPSAVANSADPQDGADEYTYDDDTLIETEEQIFSWQKNSEINCDDVDINPDNAMASDEDNAVIQTENDAVKTNCLEEIRSETDNQGVYTDEDKDLHRGYQCDMCNGPIYRFRYSCVECANYDLCGACEARAAHPQHYLLRVPRPRPYGEIKLIIDTIRRFLTADPKSLRAEANFVDTLMDELKSEVLSQTGSDPVPDEPDYPLHTDDSGDEHNDCEMEESNVSLTPATLDGEAQHVDRLEENTLQEWEFPHEIYGNQKTIHEVNIANVQRPKGRIMNEINQSQPTSIGNVSHKLLVSCPNTNSMNDDVLIKLVPERTTVNTTDNPSPSNTFGKVGERVRVTYPKIGSVRYKRIQLMSEQSKVHNIDVGSSPSNALEKVSDRIFVTSKKIISEPKRKQEHRVFSKVLVTCPKTVSISDDVLKLLKTKDGDIVNKIDTGSSPSNALEKVSERIFVTSPKKVISYEPNRKQEHRVLSKVDGVSPSNTIGKVSKKTLVTCPKTVSISDDVLKLLKTKDGDLMQTTINTIKHSLKSKVSIQLERLSQDQIKPR